MRRNNGFMSFFVFLVFLTYVFYLSYGFMKKRKENTNKVISSINIRKEDFYKKPKPGNKNLIEEPVTASVPKEEVPVVQPETAAEPEPPKEEPTETAEEKAKKKKEEEDKQKAAEKAKADQKAKEDKAKADKAVLEEAVAGGQSKEEALAQYLTDENFESWYEEFCNSLNAAANS